MTDPLRPDDELVSAVLDGEATPDERARVEADPVLSARLAEFAAVRDAIAEPVPPTSDAAREQAIAAAKRAARPAEDGVGTVRPLRRRGSSDVPRFLGVAAAVLLVLVGFGLLANVSGDDSSEDSGADSAALSPEDGDTEGSGEELLEESADAEGDRYLSELSGADLGQVETQDELADTLQARSSEDGAASDTGEASSATTLDSTGALPQANVDTGTRGASEDCEVGLVEADERLSGLLARARVDYAGEPAVVYVYATPEGRQRVVVVTVEGCRTLAAFDL